MMATNLFFYQYLQDVTPENTSATIFPLHNAFLQNILTIIEDNLNEPALTVGFLATKMSMSRSTLNRRLSSLIALSAIEVISQCKLRKAASYLLGGKNVSETAYLAGFETPSYFIQCFKALYKITPKEFSKANSLTKTA